MSKFKKALEWVISILVVIIFIFSAVAMIGAINGKKTGVNSVFGKCMNAVQSNSMEPTFYEGDLIIGTVYDGGVLEKNQIVTYRMRKNNKIVFNTHRIVGVEKIGEAYIYETKGDNEAERDDGYRLTSEIVATYDFRIPYVGGFIDWLKSPVGFILCVIMPIVGVILYEAFRIVSVVLKTKDEKLVAATAEETSEDVKAEIIKQYLASQKEAQSKTPEEETPKGEEAPPPKTDGDTQTKDNTL